MPRGTCACPRINDPSHPLVAAETDSISQIHAAHSLEHRKIAELCSRLNMPQRVPDTYTRAINLLKSIPAVMLGRFESALELLDDIRDDDMTYDFVVKLLMSCEHRSTETNSILTDAKQFHLTTDLLDSPLNWGAAS